MSTRTYKVTPAQMESFKSAILSDKDTKLEGSEVDGVVTHGSGMTKVVLNYKFDPQSGTLLIGIQHKPFVVSDATIFNHIEQISGLSRT